jgi:hypothetical protein
MFASFLQAFVESFLVTAFASDERLKSGMSSCYVTDRKSSESPLCPVAN